MLLFDLYALDNNYALRNPACPSLWLYVTQSEPGADPGLTVRGCLGYLQGAVTPIDAVVSAATGVTGSRRFCWPVTRSRGFLWLVTGLDGRAVTIEDIYIRPAPATAHARRYAQTYVSSRPDRSIGNR